MSPCDKGLGEGAGALEKAGASAGPSRNRRPDRPGGVRDSLGDMPVKDRGEREQKLTGRAFRPRVRPTACEMRGGRKAGWVGRVSGLRQVEGSSGARTARPGGVSSGSGEGSSAASVFAAVSLLCHPPRHTLGKGVKMPQPEAAH